MKLYQFHTQDPYYKDVWARNIIYTLTNYDVPALEIERRLSLLLHVHFKLA